MGGSSPSVFHTTPPQPALKARTTLYSLSVGGAEASQNGFGDLMPTKLVRRSATNASLRPPRKLCPPHPEVLDREAIEPRRTRPIEACSTSVGVKVRPSRLGLRPSTSG